MKEFPEYTSHHDNHQYLEKDWFAHEADDQLPILSAMGAGPRGEGLTVQTGKNADGEFTLDFVSTLTGEVVYSTPNLAAGKLSISVEGENIAFTVKKGVNVETTTVALPKLRGSQICTTDAGFPAMYKENGQTVCLLPESMLSAPNSLQVGDILITYEDGSILYSLCTAVGDNANAFSTFILLTSIKQQPRGQKFARSEDEPYAKTVENGHIYRFFPIENIILYDDTLEAGDLFMYLDRGIFHLCETIAVNQTPAEINNGYDIEVDRNMCVFEPFASFDQHLEGMES